MPYVRVLHCPKLGCDWKSPLYTADDDDLVYRQSYDRHFRLAHTPEPTLQVYERHGDDWVEVQFR